MMGLGKKEKMADLFTIDYLLWEKKNNSCVLILILSVLLQFKLCWIFSRQCKHSLPLYIYFLNGRIKYFKVVGPKYGERVFDFVMITEDNHLYSLFFAIQVITKIYFVW